MVNAEFVAGLSAGAATTLIMHPLDLIKVRLQVDDYYRARTNTNTGLGTQATGMTGRVRHILASFTSYKDLYRGLGVNIVGNTVSWGLYFALYNRLKRELLVYGSGSGNGSGADGKQVIQQQHLYLAAAMMAGTTTSFLTNPLWVLKTRMLGTSAAAPPTASNSPGVNPTVAKESLRSILRNEGLPALWRGFVPGLFGVVQSSLQFTVYEDLKQRRLKYHRRRQEQESAFNSDGEGNSTSGGDGKGQQLPTLEYLSISACSKIIATVLLYPYQLVRSRMQMPHRPQTPTSATAAAAATPVKHTVSAFRILAHTVRTEGGYTALYKGLGANLLKVVPSTCITFLVYEKVQARVKASQQQLE